MDEVTGFCLFCPCFLEGGTCAQLFPGASSHCRN